VCLQIIFDSNLFFFKALQKSAKNEKASLYLTLKALLSFNRILVILERALAGNEPRNGLSLPVCARPSVLCNRLHIEAHQVA
jgi:hypothetical protein